MSDLSPSLLLDFCPSDPIPPSQMLEESNSPLSAFSVLVPPLIARIDRFFRDQCLPAEAEEEAEKGAPIGTDRLEQQLIRNLRNLWTFQRRKLLEGKGARMALFLNPSNLCQKEQIWDWEEVAATVVEHLAEEAEGEEETGEEGAEQRGPRTDIQVEW